MRLRNRASVSLGKHDVVLGRVPPPQMDKEPENHGGREAVMVMRSMFWIPN
jgi:hypothetical protein